MTRCRMCSQRLTRPGRLCRECEHELERARVAAESLGDLGSLPVVDAAPGAQAPPEAGGSRRLRLPLIAAAFSVGIASAAAIYATQQSMRPHPSDSVMLDRDVSSVKPRVFLAKHAADDPRAPPSASTRAASRRESVTLVATAATPATGSAAPVQTAKSDDRHGMDRVLALSDALAQCDRETFFERLACEQRARARYCDGAETQLPQCAAEPPRDHGQ